MANQIAAGKGGKAQWVDLQLLAVHGCALPDLGHLSDPRKGGWQVVFVTSQEDDCTDCSASAQSTTARKPSAICQK